jgi:hypothetical protein
MGAQQQQLAGPKTSKPGTPPALDNLGQLVLHQRLVLGADEAVVEHAQHL